MTDKNPDWRMPAAYLKLILQAGEAARLPAASLLRGTALDGARLLQSDKPVGFRDTLSVLENAERLFGPGWHLRLGQRLTVAAHGPLGFAVVTAPTLGAALDVVLRYMGTRAPFLWSAGTVEEGEFVFRFFDAVDMGDQRRTLIELAALSLQGLIERPLGREIRGAHLSLAYHRPAYGDALEEAFNADLTFGAERHALRLPAAWLKRPCALRDEAMHRYLLARCEEELAVTVGGLPAEVGVRQALLAHVGGRGAGQPSALPGLAEVAATQHVSPRTLIRRLKRGGTSFQRIVEDVRKTLARDQLLHSDSDISQIAARLGYQDPSNFGRAFRRWHGLSPRAYRNAKG